MRFSWSLILIVFLSFNSFAQNGFSHFQSFDRYDWKKKSDSTLIVSVGQYKETYIAEFNLNTRKFKYLNDSTDLRFTLVEMHGDTGVAITNVKDVYYTHDNWKTMAQANFPTTGLNGISKTHTGFLAYYSYSTTGGFYYSKDGANWVKPDGPVGYSGYSVVAEKDGKTWVIGKPSDINISYDGGKSFLRKKVPTGPSVTFLEYIPYDTVTGLGISNIKWYTTLDGGDTWTDFTPPIGPTLLYAPSLDTLIVHSSVNGVQISLDTGKTWNPFSIEVPNNYPSRFKKVGNHLVTNAGSTLYSSGKIGAAWDLVHITVGGGYAISMKGDFGLMGGKDGKYAYTRNGGKTFIKPDNTKGSEDLLAVEVVNDTIMLIADRKSNIWLSNDAGETWKKRYSNSQNYFGKKFRYNTDLSKLMLIRNGQPLLSKDQGNSWKTFVNIGGTFDGTVTPNGSLFFITNNSQNEVLIEDITESGKRNEVVKFSEQGLRGIKIEMLDDQTGYCLAIHSGNDEIHAFKTTNGWKNYTFMGKFTNPSQDFGQSLYFELAAKDTLYTHVKNVSNFSASKNELHYSYDGGKTWKMVELKPAKTGDSNHKLQGMCFYNGTEFISVWENTNGRIYTNRDLDGNPTTVYVTDVLKLSDIHVYPNPFSNRLHVQCTDQIDRLVILDLNGRVVHDCFVNGTNTELDLSHLTTGMYVLQVLSGSEKHTAKLFSTAGCALRSK